ncbi:MAG: DEAD/DEAH box helicase [Lentisphaeria bacterium]|nr:DEAD/DEAH box helicase [Lentisphaeria bacterium]
MGESFEARLVKYSSKEIFKKAKHLLHGGELLCCHETAAKSLRAVFRDSKGSVTRVETFGFPYGPYRVVCSSCGSLQGLCAHGSAACLYHAKYTIKEKGVKEVLTDAPAQYAGLKFSGMPELLTQVLTPQTAQVILTADTEFPHVPSKWERIMFTVRLTMSGREYTGNLNNLRQLHFGKNLAAALKLEAFPLQDRQIIRFLAINAQQEGTRLSLDAEQTAEFFHCLVGFQNFTRLGEKVVVHREQAEPVVVVERVKGGCLLRSAVIVKGSPLPLNEVKLIVGRAGAWVGMLGEYWWIPAQMDVSWLRNFLRTTVQTCDLKAAKMLVASQRLLPFKLIVTGSVKVRERKVKPCYQASLTEDSALELEILFDYGGHLCKADQSRLASSGGQFWKRNTVGEERLIQELVNFGFEMLTGQSTSDGETRLILRDREAVGTFVDELIPQWLSTGRDFLMSSDLARLCGDAGRLMIETALTGEDALYYELTVHLSVASKAVSWRDLVTSAKNNELFFSPEPGYFIKVPKALRQLASAMAEIVQTRKTPEVVGEDGVPADVLLLPRAAAVYWAELASDIPGAVPLEFLRLKADLEYAAKEALDGNGSAENSRFAGSLRKYQQAGMLWMQSLGRRGYNLILADEMGLGKTVQTLALLASDPGHNMPALIVCPTSLLENWVREAEKFVPTSKVLAITGPDRSRLWENALLYDICICSYALIKRDADKVMKLKFKYLILDEAQHIKNPSTGNSQICKSIMAEHKLVLTGTPLENSPEDLWSIFDFLHPGILGSLNSFRRRYIACGSTPELLTELSARIAPFILRRKKTEVYAEIPPKTEQLLYCDMDDAQKKLYDRFLSESRQRYNQLRSGDSRISRFEILSSLLRMRQVCCDPALLPEGGGIRSAKMELLKELLLETIDSGHKVLLFSQFTSLLAIVREWLDKEGIRYEYLDGSTRDRMERVDSFNNTPEIPLFLLSLKAGGLGLNLTSADTVILYDPWWNPAAEAQAADRTHRIGQTRSVNCIKLLVKNSIEDKVLELQRYKAGLFNDLVEASSEAAGSMTLEDFEFLLKE